MTSCVFSTSALATLADFIKQAELRKAEKKLADERNKAAFGDNVSNPVQINTPVGAG